MMPLRLVNAMAMVSVLTMSAPIALATAASACTGSAKIIVAYPPGAPDDLIARLLAQRLGSSSHSVIVENLPGAGGKVGNAAAAKAAPDGCTLLVANPNVAVQDAAGSKLSYDIQRGFEPVALLATAPEVIVVHPGVQAQSIKEFAALVQAGPTQYSYASPGFGSSPHLAAERLFRATLGLDIAHVPHQGGPPAVNSTLGGHTQVTLLALPVVLSAVQDGKLRLLAVASKDRLAAFPQVATLADVGFPGHETSFWNVLLAPAGTPGPVLENLHQRVTSAMASEDIRSKLAAMGFAVAGGTRGDAAAHLTAEIAKFKDILAKTSVKIE